MEIREGQEARHSSARRVLIWVKIVGISLSLLAIFTEDTWMLWGALVMLIWVLPHAIGSAVGAFLNLLFTMRKLFLTLKETKWKEMPSILDGFGLVYLISFIPVALMVGILLLLYTIWSILFAGTLLWWIIIASMIAVSMASWLVWYLLNFRK